MNYTSNNGCSVCSPGIAPLPPPNGSAFSPDHFPVGMGYVPWQTWENTYPLSQAFHRGTIFPSLDYPFMKGRCKR